MSTSKPEAGQWWVANEAKSGETAESTAVRIEHILPNGEIVVETYPNKFFVWSHANAWHHEPRCTGWGWVVPADPTPPAEQPDPDEWVVQDRVPVRLGDRGWWANSRFPLPSNPLDMVPVDIACDEFRQGMRHGHQDNYLRKATLHVMCRRRDLPPVEQCAACDAPAEPGTVGCKDCNEYATAICSPEPQPVKTRVRLWKNNYGSVMSNDDCKHLEGWQEIHHDAEGFYVI